METQTISNKPASVFVNVLGWIMLLLTGFSLLMSVLKTAYYVPLNLEGREHLPDNFPFFIFDNMRLITAFTAFIMLAAFIASIGLILKQEWARKLFKILLGIAILYTAISAVFGILVITSAFTMPEIPEGLAFMPVFISLFIVIFCGLFIFLYIWLFRKLSSNRVKEVFIR